MSWEREWRPYVPVAERKRLGTARAKQRLGKGAELAPVTITGKGIAHTFWGKGWCDHFEKLRDYSNRLPRGRTYVRNGSVVHLSIESGHIAAFVCGSELYQVRVIIKPMSQDTWKAICGKCASSIHNLIDLMRGKLPESVIATLTDPQLGMFPQRGEISLGCDCPDSASLCKHLAAVLYGVGNRLDHSPELLFLLRGVEQDDLIGASLQSDMLEFPSTPDGTLDSDDLESIFGIELASTPPASPGEQKRGSKKMTARQAAPKKSTTRKRAATKNATANNKKVASKKLSTKKKVSRKKNAASKKSAVRQPTASKRKGKGKPAKTPKAK